MYNFLLILFLKRHGCKGTNPSENSRTSFKRHMQLTLNNVNETKLSLSKHWYYCAERSRTFLALTMPKVQGNKTGPVR